MGSEALRHVDDYIKLRDFGFFFFSAPNKKEKKKKKKKKKMKNS